MKYGFTLVELLLVVAIIMILTAAAVPLYGNLQLNSNTRVSKETAMQALRLARQRSLSGYQDSMFGVYFDNSASGDDQLVVYKGASYVSRDVSEDRFFELPNGVDMTSTITANELTFSRDLGVPSESGIVAFSHGSLAQESIVINNVGLTW